MAIPKKQKLIFLILGVALVLRLISLNQSLWLDEAISAIAVRDNSYWDLLTKFSLADTHPPLFYVFLKFWTGIFGYKETVMRVLSVVLGVATVWTTYQIGKHILGQKKALIASAFLATAPLHIYYSQEVRMYSLIALLVCLVIYFLLKQRWVFFSISILLLGLTDYLPLLILIPIISIGLFTKKNKLWWRQFIISLAPLGAFFAAWVPFFRIQSRGTTMSLLRFPQWKTVLGSANHHELALVWVKFVAGRISFDNNILYASIIAITSIPSIYLLIKSLIGIKRNISIWLWFLIPLFGAFAGSLWVPGFSYFRLLFILPAFYLLLAAGAPAKKIISLSTSTIIVINLIFSAYYLITPKFWREDWRSAVSTIETKLVQNEIVLHSFPEPFAPYRWYGTFLNTVYGKGRGDYSPGLSSQQSSALETASGIYTFDYLMDLADPDKKLFSDLETFGFSESDIFSFPGVGQVRYWVR